MSLLQYGNTFQKENYKKEGQIINQNKNGTDINLVSPTYHPESIKSDCLSKNMNIEYNYYIMQNFINPYEYYINNNPCSDVSIYDYTIFLFKMSELCKLKLISDSNKRRIEKIKLAIIDRLINWTINNLRRLAHS